MKRYLKVLLLVFVTVVTMIGAVTTVGAYSNKNEGVSAPQNVKAVNLDGGVKISWDKQINADGYIVYRQEGDTKKVIGRVNNGNRNVFADKTVVSGGKYNYTVSAYKSRIESPESKYSRTVYLEKPVISSITISNKGFFIKWNEITGAESYTVYRNNGRKTEVVAVITDGKNTSCTDETVLSGKSYKYTVIARSAGYNSAFEYKTSPVYLSTPTLKSAVNGNGYITVTWNPVLKAEKYNIYRKTNNSGWSMIATVNAATTSVQDKNVVNGTTYIYTVRAAKGNSLSDFDKTGIAGNYVSVPSNIKVLNSNNCLAVSWNAVADTSKYFVYRKDTKNTAWKLVGEAINNYYADATIQNGEIYTYTVRAQGKNGGLSWFLSGTQLIALKAPVLTVSCVPDGIMLSWPKMSTATEYQVFRKAEGETLWKCIRVLKGNSVLNIVDKNVLNGKTYTYTIKQVMGSVLGSYNFYGVSTKFYTAPTLIARHSPKGVLLNWSKAQTGTGYVIEHMTETSGVWSNHATINGITTIAYNDSKVSYGELNYYRIRVIGSDVVSYATSIYGIDPNKPAVALTYDDGPYTPVTNRILDTLEKYDSRATFFVVGSRVNTYADCIRREAQMGCEIANHTYNHKILTSADNKTIKSEIENTNTVIKNITGKAPTIVRAPGGAVDSRVKGAVGYPLVNWSVDTLDWKNSSGVVSAVKNNVKDGSIVLMHDLYGTTASATELIVPWLVGQGYQLVTVTELMELNGIYMEAGNLYNSAY